ncbi:hypothetical protein [Arthrobacter woluwensis]|uniref:hypothetical protein n=1 Tax=Arthrobacter woluwensis TaxID=156980 RepID=UPI0037FDFF52
MPGEEFARTPWTEDPDWIWDRSTNPGLTKEATLLATVQASSGGIELAVARFTKTMGKVGPNHWSLGGADIVVAYPTSSTAELRIISSGEDALESLTDAAHLTFNRLIAPNPSLLVQWTQLPLRPGP